MSISPNGRVALRELMEQAWQQVEGQAREMLKRAVEGLLVAERGAAAGRESISVGLHGEEVLDDVVGKLGTGARTAAARAGRDRAGGTL